MSVTPINNLWAELCEPLILEQYKESPNLIKLIKALVGSSQGDSFENVGQSFEEAINSLHGIYNIDEATGAALDIIGGLRNLPRNIGEGDDEYRARLVENIGINNSGTPNYLIYMAAKKSTDPVPQYLEESQTDAPTAFVYTPGGRQLERAFTARHTPAGVSGFPGAAICFADGSAMMDAGGKIFLAVADDAEIDGSTMLATEAGEILMTEAGEMILIETEA